LSKKSKSSFLQLEGASVHYGRAIALSSTTFKIDRGETVAVIGPNGTGKTTLLRAISGLVELEHGKIFFEDKIIAESTKSEFRVLGKNRSLKPHQIVEAGIIHCPERRRLFSESSVLENLLLGAYTYSHDKERVEKTLEIVLELFPELNERINDRAGQFSGGQQQMIAIGRSLMGNPKLLLLDEPSLGLAPKVKKSILDAIMGIKKTGTTILLVEQDVNMALQICERGYLLENGRIELEGSKDELLNNPHVKEGYLGI
jgi:branched-chain amino acid transport system ATP-binding protein